MHVELIRQVTDLQIAAELVKLNAEQTRPIREAIELAPSLFAFPVEQIAAILDSIADRPAVEVVRHVPVEPEAPAAPPQTEPKRQKRTIKVYSEKVLEVAKLDPTGREDLVPVEGWYSYQCQVCPCQFFYPHVGRRGAAPTRCYPHIGNESTRVQRLERIEAGLQQLGDPTHALTAGESAL